MSDYGNRSEKIQQFCPAVKRDGTTFPRETLEIWFDDAFGELRSKLCPPFSKTEFDTLNVDTTATADGIRLIARYAALMLYRQLPGTNPDYLQRLEDGMEATLEKLQAGEDSLYLSTGIACARDDPPLRHTIDGVQPTFSRSLADSDGNQLQAGTLNHELP